MTTKLVGKSPCIHLVICLLIASLGSIAIPQCFAQRQSNVSPCRYIAQSAEAAKNDAIYLNVSDLPAGFKMTEDYHDKKTMNDAPPAFTKYGGIRNALKVFQGPDTAPLQRIVDIRFVFPDHNSAEAFLQESMGQLGEKMPQVRNAPTVGDGSLLLGGENEMLKMMTGEGGFYSYCYLFVSGRVVGKVYAAQGSSSKEPLRPEMLYPIAKKAAQKASQY